MSQAVTFKCPSCGAYLEFDPAKQSFHCPFCDGTFDEAELIAQSKEKEQQTEKAQTASAVDGAHLRTYHCQTCGAEIVTDDTTAATQCYYCHNPIVLSDRLSQEFQPDGVLPFTIDREQAEQKFEKYLNSRHFVDRRFFSKEQRENISGVYYPYWFADIEGNASFEGEGKRISTVDTPREVITTTRIFRVNREGRLSFRNLVRQALSKNDRKLSDGIHPYNLEELKPFAMGYLSGFLAERRDVERAVAEEDMVREAQNGAQELINRGTDFNSLTGTTNFRPDKVRMRYCLLPTWVLTYRGDQPGTTYYFMMNGQTGTTCGRLPIKWSKLIGTAAIVGGVVAALLCAGGAMIW